MPTAVKKPKPRLVRSQIDFSSQITLADIHKKHLRAPQNAVARHAHDSSAKMALARLTADLSPAVPMTLTEPVDANVVTIPETTSEQIRNATGFKFLIGSLASRFSAKPTKPTDIDALRSRIKPAVTSTMVADTSVCSIEEAESHHDQNDDEAEDDQMAVLMAAMSSPVNCELEPYESQQQQAASADTPFALSENETHIVQTNIINDLTHSDLHDEEVVESVDDHLAYEPHVDEIVQTQFMHNYDELALEEAEATDTSDSAVHDNPLLASQALTPVELGEANAIHDEPHSEEDLVDQAAWSGSLVVNDPKGELYEICAQDRMAMGLHNDQPAVEKPNDNDAFAFSEPAHDDVIDAPELPEAVHFAEATVDDDGLAAFFRPLSAAEKAQAQAMVESSYVEEDIAAVITWAQPLGVDEAPRDPTMRMELVALAIDLGMTDVIAAAAEFDPHPSIRRSAAAALEDRKAA